MGVDRGWRGLKKECDQHRVIRRMKKSLTDSLVTYMYGHTHIHAHTQRHGSGRQYMGI